MTRKSDILFIAILSVLALALAISQVAISFTLAEQPSRSYLEGRRYTAAPSVSITSIKERSFQNQAESYLSDRIINRDSIILANASLQRRCIELANIPFGYEAYPTFYGSGYLVYPAMSMVYESPVKATSGLLEAVEKSKKSWNDFFVSNDDINWVVYMPERTRTASFLPSSEYYSDMADYAFWDSHFLTGLCPNGVVVSGEYYNLDDYLAHYYRTDHHWQIDGALAAYEELCEALGINPMSFSLSYKVNAGPFYGSASRNGLAVLVDADEVLDVELSLSNMHVAIDGKNVDVTALDKGAVDSKARYQKKETYDNLYGSWFHDDYGIIEINNPDAEDRTLLLVADSFSNNMERFFALHYRKVFVIDPRHYNESVSSFINHNKIDDGVVLLSSAAIASNEVVDNLF